MKNLIILFIFNLNFLNFGFTQKKVDNYISYYNLCDDAIYFVKNQDYKQSLVTFEEAFQKVNKPYYRHYYYAGRVAALAGDEGKMHRYFELAYLNGCFYRIEDDTLIFNKYKTNPQFQKLVNNQDSLIAIFESKLDVRVKAFVDSIDNVDQELRIQLNNLDKTPDNQFLIDSLWKVDEFNTRTFLEYVKRNGFPSYREVGNEIAEVTLIHCVTLFKEYQEILLGEVKKGNLTPFGYASIYDRTYGPDNCLYKAYPSCDSNLTSEEIFKNCRSIGLETFGKSR